MKTHLIGFFKRGMIACWGGPIILAIIYIIVGNSGTVTSLDFLEAAKAIITITLLAFIAAGITVVYKIESIPLFFAILIHGIVLYFDYIIVYLFNGWLTNIKAFTVIFIIGYAIIWLIIFIIEKKNTARINEKLNV